MRPNLNLLPCLDIRLWKSNISEKSCYYVDKDVTNIFLMIQDETSTTFTLKIVSEQL